MEHGDDVFALRTFRADGTAVSTPVWLTADPAAPGVRWFGFTPSRSGKVRRIHGDPRVEVARPAPSGAPAGPWHTGTARIASREEFAGAAAALRGKYGARFGFFRLLTFLGRGRRHGGRGVVVVITLAEPWPGPDGSTAHDGAPELRASRTARPRIDSPSGLLLSSLPSASLAPLNAIAGPRIAVACAAVLATLIAIARVRRGHPKGPAFGGLVGVTIAGFAAWTAGSGSGLFVPDLVWYLVAATVLAGSVVLGRPLVGLAWALVVRPADRRAARSRGFGLATGILAAMFVARFVVTRLVQADQTDPGWVALKVASGFPLTAAGLGVVAWAWHRASPAARVRTSSCPGHS